MKKYFNLAPKRRPEDKTEANPRKRRRKQPVHKRSWTENEKTAVMKHFQRDIMLKRLPGKEVIEKCIQQEEDLQRRTWKNIKDYVRNQFGKHKKCQ